MKRALLSLAIAAVVNAAPLGYALILPAQSCIDTLPCEPIVQGAGIFYLPGFLLVGSRSESLLLLVAVNTGIYALAIWWVLSRRARRQDAARRTLPLGRV